MSAELDLYNLVKDLESEALSNEKRRGEIPQDQKPREQLLSEFEREASSSMRGIMRYIVLPEPYLPCTVPLGELSPIALRELQLETHHRGRYVMLHAITEPKRFDGVMLVVEDEAGSVTLVDLYNQVGPRVARALEDKQMPALVVFVVKEPFFHVTHRGDYAIRVDHPSDIVWLPENDKRLPAAWGASARVKTVKDWLEEGAAAYEAGYYRRAIAKYSTAMKCDDCTEELQYEIRDLRALANLKWGSGEHAAYDAIRTGPQGRLPAEGIDLACIAYYRIGAFKFCLEYLEGMAASYGDELVNAELMRRVRRRLNEKETGNYDFDDLYAQVERGRRELDIALYEGPICAELTGEQGRRLTTAESVKAGQLLLVEKAFDYCGPSVESEATSTCLNVVVNPYEFKSMLGSECDIVSSAIQKAFEHKCKALTWLAYCECGSYSPANVTGLVDDQLVVDYFHFAKITQYTAFRGPLSTYHSFYGTHPVEQAAREAEATASERSLERFRHRAAGLWPIASLLKHDCVGNVERSFIGDVLILRAAADLPADTELTTAFVEPDDPQAALKLRQYWGIECRCALCADAERTPLVVAQRRMRAEAAALHALSHYGMARMMQGLEPDLGLLGARPDVALATVETHVLAAAREYATRRAPASAASAPAATAAGGAATPAMPDIRVPRQSISSLLRRLSLAFAVEAAATPVACADARRAHANKAAGYALASLRQLGYTVREVGGRWRSDNNGASSSVAHPSTASSSKETAGAASEATLEQGKPTPAPPLVVDRWGTPGARAEKVWLALLDAYQLGGASAALVDAAREYARTAYRITVGEDVTFDRVLARVSTEKGRLYELGEGGFMVL